MTKDYGAVTCHSRRAALLRPAKAGAPGCGMMHARVVRVQASKLRAHALDPPQAALHVGNQGTDLKGRRLPTCPGARSPVEPARARASVLSSLQPRLRARHVSGRPRPRLPARRLGLCIHPHKPRVQQRRARAPSRARRPPCTVR